MRYLTIFKDIFDIKINIIILSKLKRTKWKLNFDNQMKTISTDQKVVFFRILEIFKIKS